MRQRGGSPLSSLSGFSSSTAVCESSDGLPAERRPGAQAPPPAAPPPRELPWFLMLISYSNMRLTIPTFLAWGACIAFHHACTLHVLDFANAVGAGAAARRPPLPDVLHNVLPNLQPWRALPEALHLLPVLYFSGQLLFHLDQRSLDAFRTFLWVHGSLMVLRAVAFASTLLPDASRQCHASRYLGSCFDLIFSGHVVMMILPLLGQAAFFPDTHRAAVLALRACAAATCVLVAATRNHYTVDVLLAAVITPLCFNWWITTSQCRALGAIEPSVYAWSVWGGGVDSGKSVASVAVGASAMSAGGSREGAGAVREGGGSGRRPSELALAPS